MTTRRVWALANIALSVALVPALFPGGGTPNGPVAVATDTTVGRALERPYDPAEDEIVVLGLTEQAAAGATTTTTTAPPPSTTVAVRRTVTAATAATATPKPAPTTTTTAAPKPKPTTTTTTTKPAPPPPPPSGNSEEGKASWYDHQPGICAHKTLPFGTVVTVTHTTNGRSTRCTVGDRGPYIEGWVIDLNPREFEQLAPRSTGVIPVRLTW